MACAHFHRIPLRATFKDRVLFYFWQCAYCGKVGP